MPEEMTDNKPQYMWQAGDEGKSAAHIFETRSQLIQRRLSLIIINMVGFISTLGFSIVLTGAYPYLLQMDETADKKVLGWVLAANPIGQMISSPFFGWLGNRWNSVRWLCVITGLLNVLGFSLYASVGALPEPRRYWMIAARFIVGIAAGSVTLCITYISKATTTKERTTFISINAFVSTVGFIIGPVIQSALIPLGREGVEIGFNLYWNMFTAAGWLSASLTFFSVLLFIIPGIFREFNHAEKEAQWIKMNGLKTEGGEQEIIDSNQQIDIKGVLVCILNFATAGFILIMIESLGTPIAMDQLGYTEEEAIEKVGIVLSAGCVLTALACASAGPIAKRITERKAIVMCGLLPLLISNIIMLPYSGPTPLMQQSYNNISDDLSNGTNETYLSNDALLTVDYNATQSVHLHNNVSRHRGCPESQEWCKYTSALHAEQLVVGFVFTAIGFAYVATMSTSTLTQVTRAGKQGTWNGIYQSGGCLSRILSPLYLTNMYTNYGTFATFGSVIAFLAIVLIVNLSFYRNLIPLIKRQGIKASVQT